MNATHRIALPTLGALLALVVGLTTAAARPARDDVFRSPRLATHPVARVALLPVVALAEDPAVERLVEANWLALYGECGTAWMSPEEARMRLDQAGERALLDRADEQIWRAGAVEPGLGARIAAVLGVDGVLAVRLDRWDIADGGRATVELTAALTHADGTLLWSISGLQGYGTGVRSADQAFTSDMSWVRPAYLEPQDQVRRLSRALYGLLTRWGWSLPEPLYARCGESDRGPDLSVRTGDDDSRAAAVRQHE